MVGLNHVTVFAIVHQWPVTARETHEFPPHSLASDFPSTDCAKFAAQSSVTGWTPVGIIHRIVGGRVQKATADRAAVNLSLRMPPITSRSMSKWSAFHFSFAEWKTTVSQVQTLAKPDFHKGQCDVK
jgi:hypothetical protein